MPYAVSYHSDGYDINIPAGRRRLDGRDVADLFAAPSLEGGPVERAALLGELTAAIVIQPFRFKLLSDSIKCRKNLLIIVSVLSFRFITHYTTIFNRDDTVT